MFLAVFILFYCTCADGFSHKGCLLEQVEKDKQMDETVVNVVETVFVVCTQSLMSWRVTMHMCEEYTGTSHSLTVFGRPFVKRFDLCYRTVVCLSVTLAYCG